jgi:hypothetical protein
MISITVWCLLGALMLVGAGCVCAFGLFLWMIAGPSPEQVLAKAQPVCEPITVALGEYHRRHGHYPQELSDLVKDGLLTAVPELPPHWGTSSKYGPNYEVSQPLDFYRLSFGYCVEGGIGPGDTYSRVLVSDDPRGWTGGSKGSMEDLIADRVPATYRERHDEKSLALFMSEVIGKADCDYLYRDRVTGWLGEGEEIDVPPDVPGAGKKGYLYQAEDDMKRRYCLVYKDHWRPFLKSYLPPDERRKYPEKTANLDDAFVDKNYPVLDKLFLIQENDGRPTWTIFRECPESPRDKPSGRHLLVPDNRHQVDVPN